MQTFLEVVNEVRAMVEKLPKNWGGRIGELHVSPALDELLYTTSPTGLNVRHWLAHNHPQVKIKVQEKRNAA